MSYTIRKATAQDFPDILELIKELAIYENALNEVKNSVKQMEEEQEHFECYVATLPSGEIIAMCLYYFVYYTWVGKSLYLDDLYVKPDHRKKGLAGKLLDKLFETAKKNNCKRVRWQVLNWNTPAIELYKKRGATIDNEWSNCDFNANTIREFKIK